MDLSLYCMIFIESARASLTGRLVWATGLFTIVNECVLYATSYKTCNCYSFNLLNAELNLIRHLLALVGARHIVHVSSIRVKYKEPFLDEGRVTIGVQVKEWFESNLE